MKKPAYLIGILLSILLLSGCGDEGAKTQTISSNSQEVTSELLDEAAQSQTTSNNGREVKSELRYDYTKNLTYSAEDKGAIKIYEIALKVMEAVNLCQEEVDLSAFDMPDVVIDMGLQQATYTDPMCSYAEFKKEEGGVYSIEYVGGTEEHKIRVAQFEEKINSILNSYVVPENDEQTVRQLYDYFVREMDYDYTLYSDIALTIQQRKRLSELDLLPKTQSEFNPFINQTGVCSGFAKSYALLLNQIGIENYLVSDSGSTTREPLINSLQEQRIVK